VADKEQLEILKQGVRAWNTWRGAELAIRPDLTRADLRSAVLTGADLTRANLREALLRDAVLTGTDIGGAGVHPVRPDTRQGWLTAGR
jgi:hypothetical protein